MILDEGKSRVLLNPKISSLKLDDGESSLKWCEWWFDEGKEKVSLVFEEGRGWEDRMISNIFLLLISWEEKSKVLLVPKIVFDLGDETEGRRLETVFKPRKDLVDGLNADGRSSLILLRNLEEEECEDLDRFLNKVLVDLNLDEARCMELASLKEDFEWRLDSSFLIEETDAMDETLGSVWKGMSMQ